MVMVGFQSGFLDSSTALFLGGWAIGKCHRDGEGSVEAHANHTVWTILNQ